MQETGHQWIEPNPEIDNMPSVNNHGAPMQHASPTLPMPSEPLSMDVTAALKLVDKTFGIERILRDEGEDRVEVYYAQSRAAYDRMHSRDGCMHLALNWNGTFNARGYGAQAGNVAKAIAKATARDVLELGCGVGFNSRLLAAQHPDVSFLGLDLLERHVERARLDAAGLENLRFRAASYEPLPDDLGQFDVAFAVETLCYARNPEAVARSIASALRPGGRFVLFDAHRRAPLDTLPADIAMATRLYEMTTAVTNGFLAEGIWEAALHKAGLEVLSVEDCTHAVLPGTQVLHERARRVFEDFKLRLAVRAMPPYLARNAVAGLMGPYMIAGPGPQFDLTQGGVSYQRIAAMKPRA